TSVSSHQPKIQTITSIWTERLDYDGSAEPAHACHPRVPARSQSRAAPNPRRTKNIDLRNSIGHYRRVATYRPDLLRSASRHHWAPPNDSAAAGRMERNQRVVSPSNS